MITLGPPVAAIVFFTNTVTVLIPKNRNGILPESRNTLLKSLSKQLHKIHNILFSHSKTIFCRCGMLPAIS